MRFRATMFVNKNHNDLSSAALFGHSIFNSLVDYVYNSVITLCLSYCFFFISCTALCLYNYFKTELWRARNEYDKSNVCTSYGPVNSASVLFLISYTCDSNAN